MNHEGSISRRNFVKTASLAATALTTGLALEPASGLAAQSQEERGKPLIGFQVEVSYLLKYGIARFLDDVQSRASVNAIMMHCVPFEASWAGLDRASNPTGTFATAHPQYYRDVNMPPHQLSSDDFNLPEAFQKITAETKKRGVKIFPWMEEDNRRRPAIKGMDELYEIDLHGRRTSSHPGGPCLNNPYFRNLLAGEVEDFVRSYDVDGVQRGTERQGPLFNALGAWHNGENSDPGRTSCFCKYCADKAAKQGIDFERVKKAFLALEGFVRDTRAGKRPRDGYYVEYWRMLLRNPELLVWETFWSDSMRETQQEVSAKAKAIKPGIPVGYHIWHNVAFSPYYRAEQDYSTFTDFADYLKPVVYDNPAGERMASFVDSVTHCMFGDLSPEQMLEFEYKVMNYDEKKFYDQLIHRSAADFHAELRELPINKPPRGPFERFSSDYVYRETKRAVDGVAGSNTRVYAGLGIDVQMRNSTPESVRGAVEAIFRAGGTGLIICTSHAAMRPENLSAVGATLRELKLV